jgi:hypothetical protein
MAQRVTSQYRALQDIEQVSPCLPAELSFRTDAKIFSCTGGCQDHFLHDGDPPPRYRRVSRRRRGPCCRTELQNG